MNTETNGDQADELPKYVTHHIDAICSSSTCEHEASYSLYSKEPVIKFQKVGVCEECGSDMVAARVDP